jgi:hypothetical protein
MNETPPPGATYWLVHAPRDPIDGGVATTLAHEKTAVRPAFTSRDFCRPCQGGWMRELDEAARPLIARLVLAEQLILTPENLAT